MLTRSVAVASVCLASWSAMDRCSAAPDVDFARDVQPILKQHCVVCHGPKRQESGYRLDVRESALGVADFGEPPIVQGKATSSPLIHFVTGIDEDGTVMPPPDEGRRLTDSQIDVLRKWIDIGAPWPDQLAGSARSPVDHWSFRPLVRPSIAPIADPWIQNPIDAYVLKGLRGNGLQPSERADRRVLIRRVHLVLLGLLPTVEEVNAFLADSSSDAYGRLIDRVLASSRFGERWARHWLDVVRFAETNGFETNRERPTAFHYRDYVVRALNDDKPYDRFVREQICGDAVGADVATGFLVAGPYDLVKSPDINLTLMQRQDELADMVNATGTTFLGLTLGCARCHSHKFDPIPQRDYYAVQAVFAGVHHGERALSTPRTEPILNQIEQLEYQLASVQQSLDQLKAQTQQLSQPATVKPAAETAALRPVVNAYLNEEEFNPVKASRLRFTIRGTTGGSEPCIDELEVFDVDGNNVADARRGTVATASGTLPNYEIHQLEHINDGRYGNAYSWISDTPDSGWVELQFDSPVVINRVVWARDRRRQYTDRLAVDYVIHVGDRQDEWREVASSRDRIPLVSDDATWRTHLVKSEADRADRLTAQRSELSDAIEQLKSRVPSAWIGTFQQPELTHRLFRGDPLAKREQVAPGGLSLLGSWALDIDAPERQRRERFAEWITEAGGPLAARVMANRLWHYYFGTGIVATPNDLGVNGARPSHPELLDWLAVELVHSGWSLKHVHRLILRSATFQQDSRPRASALSADGATRMLWRFPPRRLEAEPIRDNILALAGSLDSRMGGPGFSVFEVEMENVRHYFPRNDWGPEQWRRMIYMTKVRQEQDAVFGSFDCPDGSQAVPRRSRSTTPLQALNLFNGPFVINQCDRFAERLEREAGPHVVAQVDLAFRLTMGRPPDTHEQSLSVQLISEHGLASFCRALFNSNEFLFLY